MINNIGKVLNIELDCVERGERSGEDNILYYNEWDYIVDFAEQLMRINEVGGAVRDGMQENTDEQKKRKKRGEEQKRQYNKIEWMRIYSWLW